jgi:RNA-directed DNA polymerase
VDELKAPGKPFDVSKRAVWEAWEKVKANKGAPGVDAVTVAEFESGLRNNLYKIWNRLSSGTYFPPPVRAVEVPKPYGAGTRILGVPSVGDRVAQTVVAGVIEAGAEQVFHPDSYGYRPGRSALDAVAVCRRRCWENDWVIDLDIREFFDTMPWDLAVRAVQAVTDLPWVVLYVRRWLAAPLALLDGTLQQRDRGTPQGSAVSPVIANLFLHYAFDMWMARTFPGVAFERYVDDAVIHCVSERQAREVLAALQERMSEVGLALHPDKTRIVYCKDARRRGSHEHTSFTFLGLRVPGPEGPHQKRTHHDWLRPGDQQGRHEQDQLGGAVLAAAHPDRSFRSGPRAADQPGRARLDELLRCLLPVGAVSPPGAHQRLLAALAAQETQTAAGTTQGTRRVEQGGTATAAVLRPLGLGHLDPRRLVTRTTRAV